MYGTPNTVIDDKALEALAEQIQAHLAMKDDQKRQIGGRIRDLRENSRYTNETLAQAAGVSARAVGKWIEGKGISRDSAEKVAEIFDVDPDWLWSGRERGPAPDPFASAQPSDVRLGRLEKAVGDVLSNQVQILEQLEQIRSAQEAGASRSRRAAR